MPNESYIDEGGKPPLRETASRLIETGMGPEAVAVYGTSVESIRKILTTGKIEPAVLDDTLPYQAEITEGGRKKLYFALPVTARIEEINPDLHAKLIAQFEGDEKAEMNLSTAHVDETVRGYAGMQAEEDFFAQATGISAFHTDIRKLAELVGRITPDDSEPGVVYPEVRSALEAAVKRKGVIIYFNKKIFDVAQVEPGRESENELTIVSEDKLGIDVISGIEPLSEEEREEILNI